MGSSFSIPLWPAFIFSSEGFSGCALLKFQWRTCSLEDAGCSFAIWQELLWILSTIWRQWSSSENNQEYRLLSIIDWWTNEHAPSAWVVSSGQWNKLNCWCCCLRRCLQEILSLVQLLRLNDWAEICVGQVYFWSSELFAQKPCWREDSSLLAECGFPSGWACQDSGALVITWLVTK